MPQVPETTLTMIVRDELINPAGGLLPLLESHAPYFPEVVVVDTGSVDGTRELLEHLAGTYKNVKVYDAKFKGYGSARQNANSKVRTKYSFCLDADERVSYLQGLAEEIEKLRGEMPLFFLNFPMHNVTQNGEEPNRFCWNPRFLLPNKVRFEREAFEWPEIGRETLSTLPQYIVSASSPLLHFLPSERGSYWKARWYKQFKKYWLPGKAIVPRKAPSQCRGFTVWKMPQPGVLERYGINLSDIIQRLEKLEIPVSKKMKRALSREWLI